MPAKASDPHLHDRGIYHGAGMFGEKWGVEVGKIPIIKHQIPNKFQ
jgi:hypothetical protein